jgi:hypothetical protein
MFGRPQAPPQKDWFDMYFHQKLMHVVDHAADWMFAKTKYWLPSVGAAMAVSIFFLSGPMAIQEGMSLVVPVLSPALQPPMFGLAMPEGPGGEEEGDEDSEDM